VSEKSSPPRENLIRAVMPGVQYRDSSDDDSDGPVLFGHFARYNEWTEIRSAYEGHFMERFAPGAFKKTLQEQRDRLRVLFQHGNDPDIGDKPIAELRDVGEDEEGAFYEARLFDGLPALVMSGLRAGQYGASHRFSVLREREEKRPERSEHNPDGLPERTVTEARLFEFGPVTFPAYAGATAGVRSMTDEFLMAAIRSDPDSVREMLKQAVDLNTLKPAPGQDEEQQDLQDAPSEDDAAERTDDAQHLTDERRDEEPTAIPRRPIYGTRRKETSQPWLLGPSKSTKRT
jgi:HK97 family phage prohead protease